MAIALVKLRWRGLVGRVEPLVHRRNSRREYTSVSGQGSKFGAETKNSQFLFAPPQIQPIFRDPTYTQIRVGVLIEVTVSKQLDDKPNFTSDCA